MSGFNLPPGVSVNDIPGNSAEDAAWELFLEQVQHEASERGWTANDAAWVWRVGREHFDKIARVHRGAEMEPQSPAEHVRRSMTE